MIVVLVSILILFSGFLVVAFDPQNEYDESHDAALEDTPEFGVDVGALSWTLVFICLFGVWGYGMYENHDYVEKMEKACAAKGGSLRTVVGAKGHTTGCVVPLN